MQLVSGSTTAERTPTALATLDASGSAQYVFDIDWQLSGTPEVAPPLVAHTGSIATVLEPGCRATAALLDAYHPSATVTFDPNVRPALIEDGDGARGRIDRLIERCDVVKASDEDMRWIDPNRSAEADRADLAGVGSVDRRGDDGRPWRVRAVRGGRRCGCRRMQVNVVDTVGAGDAFMTGLIDALWSLNLLGAERRRDLAAHQHRRA